MNDFKLKKNTLETGRYYYLNKDDSALYDSLKGSDDPKDKKIVELIMDKAKASRAAHCASTY